MAPTRGATRLDAQIAVESTVFASFTGQSGTLPDLTVSTGYGPSGKPESKLRGPPQGGACRTHVADLAAYYYEQRASERHDEVTDTSSLLGKLERELAKRPQAVGEPAH